jgi:hypothetical protein
VNASNDPKLEALLDTIAHQVKAQRHQQSRLKRRLLVNVDSDIFSIPTGNVADFCTPTSLPPYALDKEYYTSETTISRALQRADEVFRAEGTAEGERLLGFYEAGLYAYAGERERWASALRRVLAEDGSNPYYRWIAEGRQTTP